MFKILTICTGNTCRSVMAQFLIRKVAAEAGYEAEVRSCGVLAEGYFKVPPGVSNALKEFGIDKIEHTPQVVTREILKWSDLALTMTKEHREAVLDQFPEFRKKVHIFRTYAGRPGPEDTADPIGKTDPVYLECCKEIHAAVSAIVEKLTAESSPTPRSETKETN